MHTENRNKNTFAGINTFNLYSQFIVIINNVQLTTIIHLRTSSHITGVTVCLCMTVECLNFLSQLKS